MAEDTSSVSLSGGSDDLEENSGGRDDGAPSSCCELYNILLVGDSGVGKTDLIGRLGEEEFKTKFHATIGINMETRSLEVDGNLARLHIWDPSGSDRFRSVIRKYFHNAQGIMFVYDVNYRNSVKSIQSWMREVQSHPSSEVRKILVGNKADIMAEGERLERGGVTFAEGEALARTFGIKFFETSTITGQNVRRAFRALCQEMKDNNLCAVAEVGKPVTIPDTSESSSV